MKLDLKTAAYVPKSDGVDLFLRHFKVFFFIITH